MMADEDSDGHRLIPSLVVVENLARVARHNQCSGLSRSFNLEPVERDVANTAVGITRNHETRSNVRSLFAAGDVRRQFGDIDLVALLNDLLDGARRDQLCRLPLE